MFAKGKYILIRTAFFLMMRNKTTF